MDQMNTFQESIDRRRMISLQQAAQSWYWKLVAGLVAIGTIANAVFQGLSYFCSK